MVLSSGGDRGHVGTRSLLGRAFETLHALIGSDRSRVGVRELATALGLPPSSAHRILGLLAAEGMVDRNPDGSYSLGLEFLRLAWRTTTKHSIRDAAEPVLRHLVESVDETATLGLYDRRQRKLLFALAVESSHPLRYFIELNEWMPAHPGASGLAICAFLTDAERNAVLDLVPEEMDARRRGELETGYAAVRARGYAVSHGQRIEGAVGLASPIFDADAAVLGTAALSIPEHRFDPQREPELGGKVRDSALAITRRVGGRPPAAAAFAADAWSASRAAS